MIDYKHDQVTHTEAIQSTQFGLYFQTVSSVFSVTVLTMFVNDQTKLFSL